MAIKKTYHNVLRDKAEERVKGFSDSNFDISLENAKELMHELEVHQVELEMQNLELREAQQKLEEAHDQYTDLFDFAPVGYLILDNKGFIKNINLTACQLLGLERLRLKGKPLSAYMFSGETNKFFLELRKAFKTGKLAPLEFKMKRKNEASFLALIHGTVDLNNYSGKNICRLALQDVTEIRKAETLQISHDNLKREKDDIQLYNTELEKLVMDRTKELSEALESEKNINELKNTFITIASHELRTPITIIMSSIILIEKFRKIGEYTKIDRHVKRIKLSIKNFTTILDDFLSLEQLERGVVRVKKEAFDIAEFLNELCDEMEFLLKSGQKIICQHEGGPRVKQDKKILHNILVNLLTNAIKYSEDDVYINSYKEKRVFCLEVRDNGLGIPQEVQANIYKSFFRAKNVADYQGTGLGLSIVERYIELLQGKIELSSTLGKGSTFTINLPLE